MNGWNGTTSVIQLLSAVLLSAGAPACATAQTEYYNLDFNRPVRVEDAVPTERRQLDLQLAPLRAETFRGGRRWRLDPLLSYGVAALTEIEIRAPLLLVQSATSPTLVGLTSVGIGAMRALNTETTALPAVAVAAEVLLPAGSLAPPNASYGVKALLTKSFSLARMSVNASYGTFSVVPGAMPAACRLLPPGSPGCNGRPTVPDVPCARGPVAAAPVSTTRMPPTLAGESKSSAAACLMSIGPASLSPSVGNRWLAGATLDHAFPLSSMLIGADLFAERLIGLSPLIDWTAELGMRRQCSPHVVFDAGVARHFAGAVPSTAVTIGATYAFAAGHR